MNNKISEDLDYNHDSNYNKSNIYSIVNKNKMNKEISDILINSNKKDPVEGISKECNTKNPVEDISEECNTKDLNQGISKECNTKDLEGISKECNTKDLNENTLKDTNNNTSTQNILKQNNEPSEFNINDNYNNDNNNDNYNNNNDNDISNNNNNDNNDNMSQITNKRYTIPSNKPVSILKRRGASIGYNKKKYKNRNSVQISDNKNSTKPPVLLPRIPRNKELESEGLISFCNGKLSINSVSNSSPTEIKNDMIISSQPSPLYLKNASGQPKSSSKSIYPLRTSSHARPLFIQLYPRRVSNQSKSSSKLIYPLRTSIQSTENSNSISIQKNNNNNDIIDESRLSKQEFTDQGNQNYGEQMNQQLQIRQLSQCINTSYNHYRDYLDLVKQANDNNLSYGQLVEMKEQLYRRQQDQLRIQNELHSQQQSELQNYLLLHDKN